MSTAANTEGVSVEPTGEKLSDDGLSARLPGEVG